MILSLLSMILCCDVSFKIVLSQYVGRVGASVALPCNVSDWDKKRISLMLWYKDKQRVPFYSIDAREVPLDEAKKTSVDPRLSLNQTLTVPHLIIQNVKYEDEGEYRCRVDYQDDKTRHSIISFKVVDIPKLWITLGANLNANSIKEGIDVILECNLISKLPVGEINWHLNGNIITGDIPNGVLVFNHSLVLQRVKRSHRGQYRCSASNQVGRANSEPFFLRVQYSPMCKPNLREIYAIGQDERATVTCQVESDPNPLNFKWFLNSTHGTYSITNFTQNETESLILYSPRNKLGYGSVFCTSSNEIGEQKEPCYFSILPPGVPEKVSNCSIKNQSLTSLLVQCQPGPRKGMITTYIIDVFKAKSGEKIASISNHQAPIFSLKHLASDQQYDLHIYAKTSGGQSRPVTVMASLEPAKMSQNQVKRDSFDDEEESNGSSYSRLLTIFLTAVAAVLLIVIMIVVIVRVKSSQGELAKSSNTHDEGSSPKFYYFGQKDHNVIVPNDNVGVLQKSFSNGDIKCLDKSFNCESIDPTFGTIFKPFQGSIFDVNSPQTKLAHLSPTRSTFDGPIDEGIRLGALNSDVNRIARDCRARISLISETCSQLLPDRQAIQVDGFTENEAPVMKNLRISCDGSEVTISFQLPRDQMNPTILNDNKTTPV